MPTEPVARTVVVVTEPAAPTEPAVPTEPSAPTEPGATPPSTPTRVTPPPTPTQEKPTPTRRPTSDLPSAWTRSMDEIEQQVIDLRGLLPSGEYFRDVLTPAELREQTIREFNEDKSPEDLRDDVLELAALGLVEPGFDLGTFYIDLLSEQVAGQYDPETKEMFVVSEQFGGLERMTYAHEYVHALQDQNYDIRKGLLYDTEPCKQDTERCAGVQALIEGDASLAETNWFAQYATAQDYTDIMQFYNSFEMPVYDSAPEFMKEDFMFPYSSGQKFVEYLYDQGGWDAVDAAYADVPVSTEQILHPVRYPNDRPVPVELADLTAALGDGWEEITRNVMGEWYTYLILAKGIDASYRLDEATANRAAEGWGGDTYVIYYNESSGEVVLAISYVWDTLSDADEFASALVQYGTKRFGQPMASDAGQAAWDYSGGYSLFRQAGQATQWIIAPSQATAEAVWSLIAP